MLKNEQGIVSSVFFLLFIPLLLIGMVYTTQHTQTVFHYDIDVQQAVTDAVRAAAFTVDPLSQANANPMIVPEQAHDVFKKVLAENLNLDEITLQPKAGSCLTKKPEYFFVVYNGENEFGLPTGVEYPSEITIDGTLPQDFQVGETGVIPGSEGNIVTTLDRPGCIAIIKCSMKSNATDDLIGIRWAAGRIIK